MAVAWRGLGMQRSDVYFISIAPTGQRHDHMPHCTNNVKAQTRHHTPHCCSYGPLTAVHTPTPPAPSPPALACPPDPHLRCAGWPLLQLLEDLLAAEALGMAVRGDRGGHPLPSSARGHTRVVALVVGQAPGRPQQPRLLGGGPVHLAHRLILVI